MYDWRARSSPRMDVAGESDKAMSGGKVRSPFVGLANQAMTCYLNSLLQTLFMTAEFRSAIFAWRFTGNRSNAGRNIPYQLQRLFLLLLTADPQNASTPDEDARPVSLDTAALTASFGWDRDDQWRQHDVQELCRAVFDALERNLMRSSQAGLIARLYQGQLIDYIQCLQCKKESSKEEPFSELPLSLCGSQTDSAGKRRYKDLFNCVSGFLEPELLTGLDQYFCDKCEKKCDALKGFRILRFPYILMIQLKRFDFNWQTRCRIKLNDELRFPLVLDLNKFVMKHDFVEENSPMTECDSSDWNVDDEEFYKTSCLGQTVDAVLKRGPFVYELFSVIAHTGSANGGHYFAFIRSLDCKNGSEWHCFNDESVTPAAWENVQEYSYGGRPANSDSAYMLVYRQVDRQKNAKLIGKDELPTDLAYLSDVVNIERDAELARKAQREMMRSVEVFLDTKSGVTSIGQVQISRQGFMWRLCEKALTLIKHDLDTEDYRPLVIRNGQDGGKALEVVDTAPITVDDNDQIKSTCTVDLCLPRDASILLLARDHDGDDRVFKNLPPLGVGGITVRYRVVRVSDGKVLAPIRPLYLPASYTTSQLRNLLAQRYGSRPEMIRIVLDMTADLVLLLDVDERPLGRECYSTFNRALDVFVDVAMHSETNAAESAVPFCESNMFALVEREKHLSEISLQLPTKEEFDIAGIKIPTEETIQYVAHSDSNGSNTLNHSPYIVFNNIQEQKDNTALVFTIDVRSSILDLKKVVATSLQLDITHFSLVKQLENGKKYDIRDMSQSLDSIVAVNKVSVKLSRCLEPGEYLLPVYKLDPFVAQIHWTRLFDLIGAKDTLISQLKEDAMKLLKQRYSIEPNIDEICLREALPNRLPKLNKNTKLEARDGSLSDPILVHIEPNFMVRKAACSPPCWLVAKHWHPATLCLGATYQLIVQSYGEIKGVIAALSGTPVERILLTNVSF